MKNIIGFTTILGGIVLAFYLGFYFCFLKGIFGIYHALEYRDTWELAWNVVRVMISGTVGWSTFLLTSFIGGLFLEDV